MTCPNCGNKNYEVLKTERGYGTYLTGDMSGRHNIGIMFDLGTRRTVQERRCRSCGHVWTSEWQHTNTALTMRLELSS